MLYCEYLCVYNLMIVYTTFLLFFLFIIAQSFQTYIYDPGNHGPYMKFISVNKESFYARNGNLLCFD